MQVTENLWGNSELGAYLGLSARTISTRNSRAPETLPPRVGAMLSPRWVPDVVRAWALKSSGVAKHKGGRPRG